MTTDGLEYVLLETHNWGKATKFLQALGYTIDFATDHGSGILRNGDGPYLFVAEVPEDKEPEVRLALKVPDADAVQLDPGVDVVTPFEETHWGTRELMVRDPDGRVWAIQAPLKTS